MLPRNAAMISMLFIAILQTGSARGQSHVHGQTGKGGQLTQKKEEPPTTVEPSQGRAPENLPNIPQPDEAAAQVPPGYRVEVVLSRLAYPTSIEFDDSNNMYVAESGYIYGDAIADARVLRFVNEKNPETVAEGLNGPVTDLLWFDHRLYISHRGKISVVEASGVRDLVTGLPSQGDHHNNQLIAGPDGKIYFGQGTATNSGVVGLDNFKGGWLAKYPEVHDLPAKEIRLNAQSFETPNPLTLLAVRKSRKGEENKKAETVQSHEDHIQANIPEGTIEHDGHKQATSR